MRRDSASGVEVRSAAAIDGQFDLAALGDALWRKRRWILIPTALAALAATVFVMLATPVYRSEALVLIENRETAYNRPELGDRLGERDRPLMDAEAVQSQVQLAYSRDLAREVIRDLKLSERPEFNPAAGSPIYALLSLVGLARDPSRTSLDERVLERFHERLTVYQVERSRVIAIDFRSESALLAAEVANAVADRLLDFQRKAKQESMRQTSSWLASEIDQLRPQVAEAEARVESFRGKSDLYIGNNNTSLSAQQLGEANTQLVQARTQRADAETKARMIREMLRTGRPIEASDIVNSELIRRLNEQRVTLKGQLAEQSSTLLEQHPRIKELKAQIADLEAQTRSEAEKLVRSLENDARIAGARVETLSGNLDQVKKQASVLGVEDVQMRALEREAKSRRDLLESYLSRYRDLSAREGPDAVPADARVLSRAIPSPTPYFPKRLPIILIVTFATMMCAVTLVSLIELLSGNPMRDAGAMVPALPTELPAAAPKAWIGAPNAAPNQERELAALAEHVRNRGRGILVVTSADGGDRAPSVAIALARELGRGARVLFLDCTVGAAPAAGAELDRSAAGFADLLFGVALFGEVIQRDPGSRIHVIPVGRGIRDTAALLAGDRLGIILGALSQTYDHVVLFVPRLAAIEGGARLARFARGVVLVSEEGNEVGEAAVFDALAARGFANVAVATVGGHIRTKTSPRAAA
jgi:succinoglycan biosynthesis transport protein ExoP